MSTIRTFLRGEHDADKALRAQARRSIVDVVTEANLMERTLRFASIEEISKTVTAMPSCQNCKFSRGVMCDFWNMLCAAARLDRRACAARGRNFKRSP